VRNFYGIMMPVVRKAYFKNLLQDISEGFDHSCLHGIAGVAGVIASFVFCIDDIRLHFRWNIINYSCWEYNQAKATSEFVEAIGRIEGQLFQHHLVEFMGHIF